MFEEIPSIKEQIKAFLKEKEDGSNWTHLPKITKIIEEKEELKDADRNTK